MHEERRTQSEVSWTQRLPSFHPLHRRGAPERTGRDATSCTVRVRIPALLLETVFSYNQCERAAAAPVSSQVMYFKGGMCEKAQFDAALSNGIPICIEDVHTRRVGATGFQYGPPPVTPIDCLTGEEAKGTWNVLRYFEMLGGGLTLYGMLKLKVSFYRGLKQGGNLTYHVGLAAGQQLRRSFCIPGQGL